MGNLSALFHSRDKPQNRTAGSSYAFFMGGTTAGKSVTERSAMQMTAQSATILSAGLMAMATSSTRVLSRLHPRSGSRATRQAS